MKFIYLMDFFNENVSWQSKSGNTPHNAMHRWLRQIIPYLYGMIETHLSFHAIIAGLAYTSTG